MRTTLLQEGEGEGRGSAAAMQRARLRAALDVHLQHSAPVKMDKGGGGGGGLPNPQELGVAGRPFEEAFSMTKGGQGAIATRAFVYMLGC